MEKRLETLFVAGLGRIENLGTRAGHVYDSQSRVDTHRPGASSKARLSSLLQNSNNSVKKFSSDASGVLLSWYYEIRWKGVTSNFKPQHTTDHL